LGTAAVGCTLRADVAARGAAAGIRGDDDGAESD
jgi:hypothetical protein